MKLSFAARLSVYLFRFGAIVLAVSVAAVTVFGTTGVIKEALSASGAYKTAADNLAGQATRSIQDQLGGSELLDNGTITGATRDSLPPEAVKEQSEQSIDGIYDWLNGKTEQPDLYFDLQPSIDSLTVRLGDQAALQAAKLPPCTPQQIQQLLASDTIDIANITCAPPGVTSQAAQQVIDQRIDEAGGILSNPVLTTDNLPKDASGRTIVDQLAILPDVFQWLQRMPWIGAIMLLAGTILTYWLTLPNWQHAVRALARSLLGIGILLVIFAGIARILFNNASDPTGYIGRLVGGGYNEVLITFISTLEKALSLKLLIFGAAYIILATIGLMLIRRRPAAAVSEDDIKKAP